MMKGGMCFVLLGMNILCVCRLGDPCEGVIAKVVFYSWV